MSKSTEKSVIFVAIGDLFMGNKNIDIKFIMNAQYRNIGNPNNLKFWEPKSVTVICSWEKLHYLGTVNLLFIKF
jgi:hypothetical protein